MSELVGRYVRSFDGLPIAAFETGNAQGVPIVFVHGFGFNHAAFLPQFGSGLADRHRLIALDLRGHGSSAKPSAAEAYLPPEVWAGDLDVVLNEFAVQDAILVGWSFGAMACMDWVRCRGTGRVRGLVFTGSNGGLLDSTPAQIARRDAALRALEASGPDFLAEREHAERFVDNMTARPVSAEMRAILVTAQSMAPLYARRLIGRKLNSNSDLLGRVRSRLLFIHGSEDRANSADALAELASRLPDASLAVMDGSGHAPFMEDPARFNRLLECFVADVAGA